MSQSLFHRGEVVTGNHAVSHAARMARVEVISAYPITPQTQVVELLSEFCDQGVLKARFIKVESEHSAMAALVGAASAGARTFTATSAHGLALMHEMLHWASGSRLPIVMANVNRAMGAPWSIWTDQNDSLSQRDTGWMQVYCESNQEVFDTVIQAYRVAEQVRLPAMVVLDAFVLSHTAEPVEFPTQDEVDRFLPRYLPAVRLNVEDPRAFGGLADPDTYMEFRFWLQEAMDDAIEIWKSVDEEYQSAFGRGYGLVEGYRSDDADLLLVTSSTITSTARYVVNQLRDEGSRVGLLKIRLFRPFPQDILRDLVGRASRIAVLDRNVGFGVGGIFAQEVRAALYNHLDTLVLGYILGLGGRDVTPDVIREVVDHARNQTRPADGIWIGLKE